MNNTIELLERAIKSLERECFDFKEAHLIADLRAEAKRLEEHDKLHKLTDAMQDGVFKNEPAQPKTDPKEIFEAVKRYCEDELGWTEYRSPKPQPKREPRWEYNKWPEADLNTMDDLGINGWELVCYDTHGHCIYKRLIRERNEKEERWT